MLENIYGTVSRVTYYNESNGFGIVKIKLNYQDNKIAKYRAKLFTNILTVVCSFERIPLVDEEYDFSGEFVNTDYGIQFKAKSFTRREVDSLEGIVTYLSSDFFPGIGKVKAKKIYEAIGKECLTKIIEDKNILNSVVGLTDVDKDTVYRVLLENKEKKQATLELLNYGITISMSIKLLKDFGEEIIRIIKTNPYKLIELVEGFGFIKADKIAIEAGIKKDDIQRIEALVTYSLNRLTYYSGDSYATNDNLYLKCEEIIEKDKEYFNRDLFSKAIDNLSFQGKIVVDEEKNIFDTFIYQAENTVAQAVYKLLNEKFDYGYNINDIDKALTRVTARSNIDYSEKQILAIKSALSENLVIITGGPGTGKSTIIKGIIETYVELMKNELAREEIALVAPTGRAAKRLKEVTEHQEAQTIHRLLGYEGRGIFKCGPDNLVNAKMIIVDEVSMVDVILASKLFSSIEAKCKVILVGDSDQLPSVGPGEVLQNLIASKEVTTIVLDKIHRQASDSTIISLAHSVNNGYLPENIMEKKHDRNFVALEDKDIVDNIIKVAKAYQEKGMDIVKDIQILVPLYKGDLGINLINLRMQEEFNPLVDYELHHLTRSFRINDKVIQLVNRTEKQVMNGDIGRIFSFDFDGDEITGVTVLFDVGLVHYKKDELEDLSHAYAISIHKSQGSEFDLVIIPFSYKYYIMLKRKLIYTAITRGKKYLIMLGNIDALNNGIKGIESNRLTKLVEKIKKLFSGFNLEEKEITPKELENVSPYDFL